MTESSAEYPVLVPKEMVNDDAYRVAALFVRPGDKVGQGQTVAELETSKAVFSLASPADGFFYPAFAVGDMVPVGERFGVVRETADAASSDRPAGTAAESPEPDSRFSLAAWELARANGLGPEAFAGLAHVRRRDVEAALVAAVVPAARPESPEDEDAARSLVMLGGGGHCRECVEIVELAGEWVIAGIIDTRARPGDDVAGYPVLGGNAVLDELPERGLRNLVLAYGIAGGQKERGGHFLRLRAAGFRFPAIAHPHATVSRRAAVGEGVQIMTGARVCSGTAIGDACIVNTNAVVSHDCRLGRNVHVAPGALLAGGVVVGDDAVVGMGATVYMRVRVGAGAIVYNGAAVFADVPDGMTVEGTWRG